MLIASLRDVIRQQSGEIEILQKRLKEADSNAGSQVIICLKLYPYELVLIEKIRSTK